CVLRVSSARSIRGRAPPRMPLLCVAWRADKGPAPLERVAGVAVDSDGGGSGVSTAVNGGSAAALTAPVARLSWENVAVRASCQRVDAIRGGGEVVGGVPSTLGVWRASKSASVTWSATLRRTGTRSRPVLVPHSHALSLLHT